MLMSDKRLSITHTVLIWTGIVLILVGIVMTLFGIGSEAAATKVTVLDMAELSTSHIGLVFVVVGAFLSGVVALRLPEDIRVFAEAEQSLTEKLAENALIPSVIIGGLAVLLLILSIVL